MHLKDNLFKNKIIYQNVNLLKEFFNYLDLFPLKTLDHLNQTLHFLIVQQTNSKLFQLIRMKHRLMMIRVIF